MQKEIHSALALAAVKTLQLGLASSSGSLTGTSHTTIAKRSDPSHANTAQCRLIEEDLLNSVMELKQ
jgi:hypothetical protein